MARKSRTRRADVGELVGYLRRHGPPVYVREVDFPADRFHGVEAYEGLAIDFWDDDGDRHCCHLDGGTDPGALRELLTLLPPRVHRLRRADQYLWRRLERWAAEGKPPPPAPPRQRELFG
jgi:hypothetical protein